MSCFKKGLSLSAALLAGALLLTACALSLPAAAHDHDEHERARQALEQGRVLPLTSVIAKVEREYGWQASDGPADPAA